MEGDHIEAEREFGPDELVFAGHFPSNKILPGVMLVEYALYLADTYLQTRGDRRRLIEIRSATFLAPVLPGTRVVCRCDFVAGDDDALDMKAVLTRDGATCAKVRAIYGKRDG